MVFNAKSVKLPGQIRACMNAAIVLKFTFTKSRTKFKASLKIYGSGSILISI